MFRPSWWIWKDIRGKRPRLWRPTPWAGAITPDYFRMMRIPLLAGRSFSDADGMKAPGVVLVSASTARRYWPNENPVGKHIKTVWEQQWRTVVGVVADVRQYDLANHTPDWIKGTIYMPYPHAVDLAEEVPATMNLLFRTTADAGRVAQEVRLGGQRESKCPGGRGANHGRGGGEIHFAIAFHHVAFHRFRSFGFDSGGHWCLRRGFLFGGAEDL